SSRRSVPYACVGARYIVPSSRGDRTNLHHRATRLAHQPQRLQHLFVTPASSRRSVPPALRSAPSSLQSSRRTCRATIYRALFARRPHELAPSSHSSRSPTATASAPTCNAGFQPALRSSRAPKSATIAATLPTYHHLKSSSPFAHSVV